MILPLQNFDGEKLSAQTVGASLVVSNRTALKKMKIPK